MRPLNTRLLKLLSLWLLLILLQSCFKRPGVWKNDEISAGTREELHELNTQVLQALKANNLKTLKKFTSKQLIDNAPYRIVELISNRLNDNEYGLFNEFYSINRYYTDDTIKTEERGVKYELIYQGEAREMYQVFFLPKKSDNKYMITLNYARLSYGWKITKFDLGPYTINGKTAPELLKLAKQQYGKKYLIDAVNNTALASTCLVPGDLWHYQMEKDVDDFYKKVLTEANNKYKFPFTIYQVHTRPQIIRVLNQTTSEGSFPLVDYLSDIKMSDTMAVKKENAEIRKVIGTILPGIDKDKKYVYYSALSEVPTGRHYVAHFDMVDKLR